MRRHPAMRPPDFGPSIGLFLIGPGLARVGPAHRLLQGHVPAGKDIQPSLAEHQEGLGRPLADPLDGHERRNRLGVVQPLQMVEVDAALGLGAGDLMAVLRLLPRQAEGAQGLDVQRQNRVRRHHAAQALDRPLPDRGGGGDRNLLLHDHAEQTLIAAGPQSPFEHGGRGVGTRQRRIGGGQGLAGGGDGRGGRSCGHAPC
ncbi:hypothetical protein D3C80_1054420 [compost metagenome]